MRVACCLLTAALLVAPAAARPPELQPEGARPVPERLRQGQEGTAQIRYTDPDGDRPQEAWLVLEGRGQSVRLPADLQGIARSYRQGVTLAWPFGPLAPGRYQAYFEVTSIDGQARYPAQGGLPLVVESLLVKWLLLAGGLALALAVVPGMVFMGARRAADPAGAARLSLAIGVVAGYAWFLFLFWAIFSEMVFLGVGIGALALTAWLWLMRQR